MNDFLDPDATRIAHVNPQTGQEHSIKNRYQNIEKTEFDSDKTVLGKPFIANNPKSPITVEIVPPKNIRVTGDLTSQWLDTPSAIKNTSKLSVFFKTLLLKKVLLFLLMGVIVSSIFAFSLFFQKQKNSNDVHTKVNKTSVSKTSVPATDVSKIKIPVSIIGSNTEQQTQVITSLRSAIDLLIDGNLKEAEVHYKAFCKEHPKDDSCKISLEILQKQLKGKSN